MDKSPSSEEKLNAVIRAARIILEKKSFTETARAIFDQCREMTGAMSGYVALLREDGQENEVLFLEAGGMPCSVDPSLAMPIRGLRAVSYETGKAAYDNDFMNSHWAKYMPEGHVFLMNVMFAPLNIDGKTAGIMGLANRPSGFTDADAEIASAFGELAAIALANSRYLDLLNDKTQSLEKALLEIKTLSSILNMCSHCRKIRDDDGRWAHLETYVSSHTDTRFSHGLCPDCLRELYPDQADKIMEELNPADKD
jgi:GAF domain-containing protein